MARAPDSLFCHKILLERPSGVGEGVGVGVGDGDGVGVGPAKPLPDATIVLRPLVLFELTVTIPP